MGKCAVKHLHLESNVKAVSKLGTETIDRKYELSLDQLLVLMRSSWDVTCQFNTWKVNIYFTTVGSIRYSKYFQISASLSKEITSENRAYTIVL